MLSISPTTNLIAAAGSLPLYGKPKCARTTVVNPTGMPGTDTELVRCLEI